MLDRYGDQLHHVTILWKTCRWYLISVLHCTVGILCVDFAISCGDSRCEQTWTRLGMWHAIWVQASCWSIARCVHRRARTRSMGITVHGRFMQLIEPARAPDFVPLPIYRQPYQCIYPLSRTFSSVSYILRSFSNVSHDSIILPSSGVYKPTPLTTGSRYLSPSPLITIRSLSPTNINTTAYHNPTQCPPRHIPLHVHPLLPRTATRLAG